MRFKLEYGGLVELNKRYSLIFREISAEEKVEAEGERCGTTEGTFFSSLKRESRLVV